MDIKKLAVMVHENAVEHSWWPENKMERSVPEMLCLIHSEVSEALEAYRNSTSKVEGYDWKAHFSEELADIAIRILDMCEGRGVDILNSLPPDLPLEDFGVIDRLMSFHLHVSLAYVEYNKGHRRYFQEHISVVIAGVEELCGLMEIDLEAAILAKHEVNKTRTYRHGNKACRCHRRAQDKPWPYSPPPTVRCKAFTTIAPWAAR